MAALEAKEEQPVIFVTTAGKVGSAASLHLTQQGLPVRHLEKMGALAQAGVEVFPRDLDSPGSIHEAVRAQPPVLIADHGPSEQEKT